MKAIILLLVVSLCVAYGQEASFDKLSALNGEYHIKIGVESIADIKCIKKLDAVLKVRWSDELRRTSTSDLTNLTSIPWEDEGSIYTKYNTYGDEWLMGEGWPINKLNQCIEKIWTYVNSEPTDKNELSCVRNLIKAVGEREYYLQRYSDNLRNSSSTGSQLPFRKFISFPEVVELIFQNREPSSWTNLELLVYAHTKSYVITEADNHRRNYFASQNCEWKNARALREAPSKEARLAEFASQVRHAVNLQLAGRLVKEWNLDTILPRERYERWLQSHGEMISELKREVGILGKNNTDVQWLCKHAAELAEHFADIQSSILLTGEKSSVHLEASDVASKARAIESALKELNDPRYIRVRSIAQKQDEGTRCLSSLVRFVENQRRYELASLFINEQYDYPELYCENDTKNHGLVRFTFCNCIGSICVSHYLVALFEEEYSLVKRPSGVYQVVRSGIKSKRKVMHCHTLTNSNIRK